MKKTIYAAVAAMLMVPAMAVAGNSTTNIKSYTTSRREARELIDRVSNGYSSTQNVVMEKGPKGLTKGVAYNEDILVVEYANLVPVQVEDNSAEQEVTPVKQKPAAKKAAVKKAKKNKKAKAYAKAKKCKKGKAYAKAKKCRKGKYIAKANRGKKMSKKAMRQQSRSSQFAQNSGEQRHAGKRMRTVYRPQGVSRVVLEEVSAVNVPGNEPLLSEQRYVVDGINGTVVRTR